MFVLDVKSQASGIVRPHSERPAKLRQAAQAAPPKEHLTAKNLHEFRDPIHVFIHVDSVEREVVNSAPFQRLRHIHQLALSYLVYPGATHKRFEHSLGVMELASRIFDVVTDADHLTDDVKRTLPEVSNPDEVRYWRRVLRMAALCHDIGHLPFSHAAEDELLPEGSNHEDITRALILGDEMKPIWEALTPPLRPEHVAKIAVGAGKAGDGVTFSTWEAILAEIIVGDVFGADRMDYLLRDSHHAGVSYGRFDHYRLIDTLRILPSAAEEKGAEPTLGVEEGGIQSAEAHLLARYFMYSQVYLHSVRRIYDIHLKDFLKAWLPDGHFSADPGEHLKLTDNEVTAAIRSAAADGTAGAEAAKRILSREHYRLLYERHPSDLKINEEPGEAISQALVEKYSAEDVRHDRYRPRRGSYDFPVLMKSERLESAANLSETLVRLPPLATDLVFIRPELRVEAEAWLRDNLKATLEERRESES